MNLLLLKGLIGIGSIGTTAAVSVGGYYWLSSSTPKTIGDKLKEKTPVGPFMNSADDSKNKEAWKTKMESYKAENGSNEEERKILSIDGITEKLLSDKCKNILETSLSDGDVEKKEAWAKKWCFKD